mmetsp:Transcript_9607/g.10667  ORF Transcript_9607/g.10667 Transcript_9607/m.10667 type:complete len:204 (-) Transcript_9607:162-773(-)|eukprot:CAMPEP_0194167342 /NCGR_PEP_ID=MMETSP0154-20130528/2651_1 /TAXON_ID=1049557 /ORGANISM="Thalassiothrix antarctica, Strain L6-D1" /LENGTH=203 /DNA_ID=CAMNT_0038878221 /DNA_START=56 /DNA_END=667 /DNA_ORIENTATION=-
MSYRRFLCVVLCTLSWFVHTDSYTLPAKNTSKASRPDSSRASSTSSSADLPANPDLPANLVDKASFVKAVETVKKEIAISDGSTPDDTKTSDENDAGYAIGKLKATLPIQAAGGLNLAEAEDSTLVLVTGVSQEVADAGIQAFDTIVGISAAGETFKEYTNKLSLEATAAVFTAAVNHALDNGKAEIELELNRLMKLNYFDEK